MCCGDLIKIFQKPGCFEAVSSCNENGKAFNFKRRKGSTAAFCRVKVDGCLITAGVAKCDYVFVRCVNDNSPQDFHFVELKGSDVSWACEQIITTVDHFKKIASLNIGQIRCHLISNSVPRAANQELRQWKQKFKKELDIDLETKWTVDV